VNVGVVVLAIAAIGAAYAGLVLRAAPTRRDNVLFGALALVDAVMTAWRGVNVLVGWPIINPAVVVPCTCFAVVMAAISIEFMASFPRRPALPAARLRCRLARVAAIAVLRLALWSLLRSWQVLLL